MRSESVPRFALALMVGVSSQFIAIPAAIAVDAFVTAAAGHPCSVATIEIPIERPVVGRQYPPLEVTDPDGRVLYPVAANRRIDVNNPSNLAVPRPGGGRLLNRVGNLIRELANREDQLQQTVARRVSFLVVGSDPLQIRLSDADGEIGIYPIQPKQDPAAHAEIIRDWWAGYTDAARRQIDAADYPAWVENYLVAMLSGRLGLPLPPWYSDTTAEKDELLSTLKLIAGAEAASQAAFRRAAIGTPTEVASLPVPPPPVWSPSTSTDNRDAGIPVEPLATRVPPEFGYIRYGSFENYLWFRDLSDEYGGDVSSMVTLRGLENRSALRVENQLHMKMTQLARMLGPTVIEDQAIVCRDLFLGDGASIGVLIKAKNAFLLRTSLVADRAKLVSEDAAVTLKDTKVADRVVSLLASGDNRVRSFMVEDGDYIFVANSRAMIRRFLEVGKTGESLAATSSFRLARQLMPLERSDTIFAYFSPEMLRELVSPGYLIELRRRLYAKADVAMVHLARRVAAQELPQQKLTGIDELTEAGFLPQSFAARPDGSGVIAVGDEVMDTLRGRRGTFLPIADVNITAVTPEESDWYSGIASQYSDRFPDMDPVMIGVQRQWLDEKAGLERITLHAEIAPWDPGKYGTLARQLGPPTDVAMKFAPDDIVAVQAHVASPQLGPPTHLFAAIKDSVPPEPEEFNGILNIYFSLRQIPGYLGAWPQPGALDRLPLGLGVGQPVGPGMSRLIGGLYRYTDGQFSILSFYPELIQSSLPHLAATDAEDSAQIRLRVGNLSGSHLQSWVNGQLYDRAKESSRAGADFLSHLSRQLRIPADQVLRTSRQILGDRLQCTLGGQYVYSEASGRWISTAWGGEAAAEEAPADYIAPMMQWFRGTRASVTQYDDRLVADAVIDLSRR